MAIIRYARVSQLEDLKAAGAETIYREKISGAHAGRPQLPKLKATLKAGDVVPVTKLDRLGRGTRELPEPHIRGRCGVPQPRRSTMGHVRFASADASFIIALPQITFADLFSLRRASVSAE